MELGIVGLSSFGELGLSSAITPWKVGEESRRPHRGSLWISVTILFPFMLFSPGDFPELLCPPGLCDQGLR